MQQAPARRSKCRLSGSVLALVAAATLALETTEASQYGRSGFSGNPAKNGGSNCTVCHAPGDGQSASIAILGPARVDAGSSATYRVTLAGAPAITGGVNVSVSDGVGALSPQTGDSSLRLVDGELAHAQPRPFGTANELTFEFTWRAPNYDTVAVIYAAGNSSNGNLDLLDDAVGHTTFAVTVVNGFEEPPPPPPPPAPTSVALERVAGGLAAPVVVTNAGDDRLFVVEQAGTIRVIDGEGNLLPLPFLDLRDRVELGGSEEGMLGLAFHPDYAENGHFYVNYIFDRGAGRSGTRIARFTVGGDPNQADADSEQVLMEFAQPYRNHNGGDLHFGPDGLLYIASGDGGSAGDPQDLAQNPGTLLGKILRIDVDPAPAPGAGPDCAQPGAGYRIPEGNAFSDGPGGAGCDEIFALGLRNPWRISFDRLTGDLWIGDVGQNRIEEVSIIAAGSSGGLNLGWRCLEGSEPYNSSGCNRSYLDPVFEYSHAGGNCSITGGFVYRGQDFPSLRGRYLFSDFCNSAIRALSGPQSDLVEAEALPAGAVLFSSFGEDYRGELYGTDFIGGALYRLIGARETDECRTDALTLSAGTFTPGTHRFRSAERVATLGAVIVAPETALQLTAPSIVLGPGFRVDLGGNLTATAKAVSCPGSAETSANAAARGPTKTASSTLSSARLVTNGGIPPTGIRAALEAAGIEPGSVQASLLDINGHWIIVETAQALQASDTNGHHDLYRLDLLSDQITLISKTPSGDSGNGASSHPGTDASGELIVFQSAADDLVEDDRNAVRDIFLHDLGLDQTVRLTDSDQPSANPGIDALGRRLVYDRQRSERGRDIWRAELGTAQPQVRMSLLRDQHGRLLDNHHPAISHDGRYLVYLEAQRDRPERGCHVHLYDHATEVYHRQPCPEALSANSERTRLSFSVDATEVHCHVPGRVDPLVLGNPLVD